MKGLIFKGNSFTYQGEHLNAKIYNTNVVSQAQNLKTPIKPKKLTGFLNKKPVFFSTLIKAIGVELEDTNSF
jgi:hypothetical protein